MANYHAHAGTVSRGKGESLAQKVAYLCGRKIRDDYRGVNCSHSRVDVVHTEVLLPPEAPERFSDPQILVTAIDRSERRRDAQTARMIDFSLPIELSPEERIALAQRCIKEFWVDKGMCALIAVHDAGKGNPHAHVILTTRSIDSDGFGAKRRDWNDRGFYRSWRKFLAEAQNLEFARKNLGVQVSEESYFVRGVDKIPTHYLGSRAIAMMKKGIFTERAKENLAIVEERRQKELNREIRKARKRHLSRSRSL